MQEGTFRFLNRSGELFAFSREPEQPVARGCFQSELLSVYMDGFIESFRNPSRASPNACRSGEFSRLRLLATMPTRAWLPVLQCARDRSKALRGGIGDRSVSGTCPEYRLPLRDRPGRAPARV